MQQNPKFRINGSKIFGVRPGSPFFFAISASGPAGRFYGAKGLPKGLELDPFSGLITGSLRSRGRWKVELSVGSARRALTIVCGDQICLTPALGWNSWNCWGPKVSQEKVLASARAMAANLKDYGWSYVNIDDGWQGKRDPKTKALQPNKKFPDMQALCAEIHRLGLKAGIYSTPWKKSYAGFAGGFSREKQDARQWAKWGFDYLKYDWYPNDIPSTARMAKALKASGRDILLSLSNTAPLKDAASLSKLANSMRTSGDIRDQWEIGGLKANTFHGVKDIWRFHHLFRQFQRPGYFNDADMLVLGKVGWGKSPKPTRLTRAEQLSHISLWALFGSPMLLGCPLDQLDKFTLSLLTNEDLLEIHQDARSDQAGPVLTKLGAEVWVKELEDGSKAVGLFNAHSDQEQKLGFSWDELGISGKRRVKNIWTGKEARLKDGYSTRVPVHGVELIHLS